MDILEVVFRSIVVYFFIVIGIRIFGKKELSQLSIIDLAFILLISNSVQNAMVGGNISLQGGLVAAATLFAVNHIFEDILFKSKKISNIVQGNPLMLVYKGKPIEKHLVQAKISMEDLESAVREHGVDSIGDADLVVLEKDRNISVLGNNFQNQVPKRRRVHRALEKNE